MRFSRSTFTEATLEGCVAAKAARVRVAAKRRVAFGEDKKSWRTGAKVRIRGIVKNGRLPTSNRPHKLEIRSVLHFTDNPGGFEVDHIALVLQPAIEKVEHLFLNTTNRYQPRSIKGKRKTNLGSSSKTLAAYLINMHNAIGFFSVVPAPVFPPPNCWIILVTAILSCCLIK